MESKGCAGNTHDGSPGRRIGDERSAVTPGMGTAVSGIAGWPVRGFIGHEGASRAAGRLYDWAEAKFTPVPETVAR